MNAYTFQSFQNIRFAIYHFTCAIAVRLHSQNFSGAATESIQQIKSNRSCDEGGK